MRNRRQTFWWSSEEREIWELERERERRMRILTLHRCAFFILILSVKRCLHCYLVSLSLPPPVMNTIPLPANDSDSVHFLIHPSHHCIQLLIHNPSIPILFHPTLLALSSVSLFSHTLSSLSLLLGVSSDSTLSFRVYHHTICQVSQYDH